MRDLCTLKVSRQMPTIMILRKLAIQKATTWHFCRHCTRRILLNANGINFMLQRVYRYIRARLRVIPRNIFECMRVTPRTGR